MKIFFSLIARVFLASIFLVGVLLLLNNLLRFNFNLSDKELKISKSNFRNKKISFSLDSRIKFNPFFSISSNINIKEIDFKNYLHNLNNHKKYKQNCIILCLQKFNINQDIIKKIYLFI